MFEPIEVLGRKYVTAHAFQSAISSHDSRQQPSDLPETAEPNLGDLKLQRIELEVQKFISTFIYAQCVEEIAEAVDTQLKLEGRFTDQRSLWENSWAAKSDAIIRGWVKERYLDWIQDNEAGLVVDLSEKEIFVNKGVDATVRKLWAAGCLTKTATFTLDSLRAFALRAHNARLPEEEVKVSEERFDLALQYELWARKVLVPALEEARVANGLPDFTPVRESTLEI